MAFYFYLRRAVCLGEGIGRVAGLVVGLFVVVGGLAIGCSGRSIGRSTGGRFIGGPIPPGG